MSIDAHPQNEWTPVPADSKPPLRRATSIAEQIGKGWRALPEQERQRWKATTNAISAEEPPRAPVQLHFQPRALPTDRELFIDELLHPEPNHHPAAAGIDVVNSAASFTFKMADDRDRDSHATALPVAGPTMLPPWRRPGAFSDGLENAPLHEHVPVPKDDDKEAAKRFCMTLESEKKFQEFEALLLAHRKPQPEAEVNGDASEQPAKVVQKKKCVKKRVVYMTWGEARLRQRMRTSEGMPTRLFNWYW